MLFDATNGSKLSSDAVVTLEANETTDWSSPSLSQVVTFDEAREVFSHFFTAAERYRYWSILISDQSNANLYVEFGKVVLGEALELNRMPANGFQMEREDRSRVKANEYGHEYTDLFPTLRKLQVNHLGLN